MRDVDSNVVAMLLDSSDGLIDSSSSLSLFESTLKETVGLRLDADGRFSLADGREGEGHHWYRVAALAWLLSVSEFAGHS